MDSDGKGKMWIVGRSFWQLEANGRWHWTWDFHGMFSTEGRAVVLCKDQHWFVAPVEIDQVLPEEPQEFAGFVVPNKSKAEPLQYKRK